MKLLTPSFAVSVAALFVALGGSAVAAGVLDDSPETVLRMSVAKDGKLAGAHNDGTVRKAGVGLYELTFSAGPTGSKVPLDLRDCAIVATPRVEFTSPQSEVLANVDVVRKGGETVFVQATRPLVFGDNQMTPFLTNVAFDAVAIC
jgi:hypothetical protein